MADNTQNTSNVGTKSFDKQLIDDLRDYHLPTNAWSYARNASNFSPTGDIGKLGNEQSNLFCTVVPYSLTGAIHLSGDKWVLFSTNDINSAAGIFTEDDCQYDKLFDDPCPGFKRSNLIIGASRATSDCTFEVYWADGLNPDRYMDVNHVPYIQSCTVVNGCNICKDTADLDCEALRLAKHMTPPCLRVEKGPLGGTLPNGSYFAVAAYTLLEQKLSDYSMPSNVQPLFSHDNVAGSLDIHIDSIDQRFDNFELVLVSIVNQQTVAHRVGTYSTRQRVISIDLIDSRWVSVPIEQIPIRNPVYEKSDGMFNVGEYLIRTGPTSKFDFNYQPLANQIVAKWVAVEYPADYYRKGGHNTGHMRDEVYPYFIRWVFDTGDKSASYHIPGRASYPSDMVLTGGPDAQIEVDEGITPLTWIVKNTATVTSIVMSTLPDGGVIRAQGYMGYWESTEIYPDDKPDVWNANILLPPYPGTNPLDYNLCGKPIRHHRFPDNMVIAQANHFNSGVGDKIRIMGVEFENIKVPVDNLGNVLTNIQGYEILRGSRQGNKTVIAKGVINNMGLYDIEDGITTRKGAYANYPYNDLSIDPFLSGTKAWDGTLGEQGYIPVGDFARDKFTFHSPDTNFSNPFLLAKELKVYEDIDGVVTGKFEYSEKHPKFKLVTNLAFFTSAIAGIGIASIAMNGQRRVTRTTSQPNSTSFIQPVIGGISPNPVGQLADAGLNFINYITNAITDQALYNVGGAILLNLIGATTDAIYAGLEVAELAGSMFLQNSTGSTVTTEVEDGKLKNIPAILRILNHLPTFLYYWSEGTEATLELIKSILKYRDFAVRYESHGFYDKALIPAPSNNRRPIVEDTYMDSNLVDFGTGVRINNLNRARTVALEIKGILLDPPVIDNTRKRVTDVPALGELSPNGDVEFIDPTQKSFNTHTSCKYVALKQRIRNQYGQINDIIEAPTTSCFINFPKRTVVGYTSSTGVVFGGDIYIGRYTEKNTFFYFYDWLYDQPDGFQYNYLARRMIPFPRYWASSEQYEATEYITGAVAGVGTGVFNGPSTTRNLDGVPAAFFTLRMGMKNSYFYLFNSGVRDFFVESEINIDLRDYGERDAEKFYDPYGFTDLKSLFDTSIIKSGNYYKYDYSLSIAKTILNYVSWGNTQFRDYDPFIAEKCYQYSPNRVIYSLPANFEARKDNWLFFLPNNYYDFLSKVISIKSINKSGAIIFFDSDSPVTFQGLDQLQTDLGTKLTIGDGGLFTQPLQAIINADRPYEYGSCQDRLSVINTPSGVFWISENQGKIYQYGGNLKDLSDDGLKWWLARYLPYQLTQQFPNFSLKGNPVIGIGCQAIYDNKNGMVYFTKRDFIVKRDLPSTTTITYIDDDNFKVNGILNIKLGDPTYFEDASFTISYDPKTQAWISWHDWHPNLLIPGKNTFMSNIGSTIWIHNVRCDSYCNFYSKDYPFEVEFLLDTIQEVNTLRSIEYQLEVYRYDLNCRDRFHVLDTNFDEATIYNTEQCSGLLKLNLMPKNDLPTTLLYPIINPGSMDILYTKEEQKYRFNQFDDITADRGEFNLAAQRMIWNTQPNGYIRTLNPNNLNYSKSPFERKRFRHYLCNTLLRRRVSGNNKFLVSLADQKNLISLR